MLHYILQTIAFQLFFLLIYDLFLKRETFFNWNRFYLLITSISSIVIPFIKFESIRTLVPEQLVIRLPEVIIGEVQPIAANPTIDISSVAITNSSFVWSWDYLLYAGMLVASLVFIYKIIQIRVLIHKNPKCWNRDFVIVNLLKSNAAFSFFNYVFLGEWIKDDEKETVLKHELVHVSQKHSLDLLLFELLRILFWFNPLIYMYQDRMSILHEYIADENAIKQSDKKQYYEKLLSQVFDTKNISFTNTFFNQSLIKKRIVMLSKSKSNRINLLKYALLIPMVFGMLMYTSSYAQEVEKKSTSQEDTLNQKLSDKDLKKKLYDEIVAMDKNGAGFMEISNFAMPNREIYISSRTEYYRFSAYTDFLFEKSMDIKMNEGALNPEDIERAEKMKGERKTYQEYLDWKKTADAKTLWENSSSGGMLKLLVVDIKNLTENEKKLRLEKIQQLENDDFFNTLVITDGKSVSKITKNDISSEVEIEVMESNDIEVPFSVIDEVPTLDECKDLATNDEKRECLSDFISGFVNKNFDTDIAKGPEISGRQRISVMFKIGKDGNIQNIMARAAHPSLEAEAKRVIALLPQFIPGKHKGKAVVVPYSLPILFQIRETEISEIPFSVVEEVPAIKGCIKLANQDEIRRCTSDFISDFVNKNFNTKLGKELKLKGPQRIAVMFKIGTDGNIFDIKVRAPHPALEAEAIRVVKALPQLIPGKQKGKNVVVPYNLPIVFQVNE